ncbi:hypothetical protein O3G_MSEX005926 [Manduca sexta]|uniref:Uncharacterized protein n=1 Tax=Manduca sexta TaxID=7130 RepID=A0A922CKH4_MANSE|nr:hypothetical protein O3G_MSEX005926 [Manduca sexta]
MSDCFNFFQDINYIDIGPPPMKLEDPTEDYLLYKFIQSLRTGDNNIPQLQDGVNWYAIENVPNPMVDDDLLPIMKRVPAQRPATTEKPKDGPVIKPLRKWHGRKHDQKNWVCYFKLCSFRLPEK